MLIALNEVQCILRMRRFTAVQLDLNLLPVLEALVEEGSVTGAAARLRLSPPAVSRSLGRLRRATGDDILVRTGRTMTRTPYAVAVRDELGDVLHRAGSILTPSRHLDLSALDRVFTLRVHDALAAALAPALLADVRSSAPGVRLRLLAERDVDTHELRQGNVDLEVGAAVPSAPELRHEVLGADGLVAVLRHGHPAAGGLDLDAYVLVPHIVVSRRGRLADPVDAALAERGTARTVVATVGSTAAAAQVVASSDAVLTAPHHAVQALVVPFGLDVLPLPLPLAAAPVVSVWHQRSDTDLAHAWLRDRVRLAIVDLLEG